MEQVSAPSTPRRHRVVCPITLDVYRDPVLAGDGHVYERVAIIKWIEQQGTSPLTRQPLNVDDLRSAVNTKQLSQSSRSNSLTYSSSVSIISSPIPEAHTNNERGIACNIKRILLIILAISVIIIPFVIATAIIFGLRRSDSIFSSKIHLDRSDFHRDQV